MTKTESKSVMGDTVRDFDKKALASLASSPVTKARNSANSTWTITTKGIDLGEAIGGQQGVIIRALASLGGVATTFQLIERIERMRAEDSAVESIMSGKADQGTGAIVAHYLSPKARLVKQGFVTIG